MEAYDEARRSVAMFDHPSTGWIEIVGPEARSFLNNLATNDLREMALGEGRELFLTTLKARVIAHGVVGCYRSGADERLLLEVDPGRHEAAFKHLNHHLISERAELTDLSGQLGRLSVVGP